MAERREFRRPQSKPSAPGSAKHGSTPDDDELLELQQQAGNKAVAELLARQQEHIPATTPAMHVRDILRAERPTQPEFGLHVQRAPEQTKEPPRLLRQGTRGTDVAALQQMLGVAADGIFGPITRAAVVGFQQSAGLAPDGLVGPLTWSALTSGKASTDKAGLASTDKLAPASTDKLAPASTDKLAPASTDKLAPESTAKLAPESTDKLAPESTAKLLEWEEETAKS